MVNVTRSEASKRKWQDPDFRKKVSEKIKATVQKKLADPSYKNEYRRQCSDATKKLWSNSEYRKAVIAKLENRNISTRNKLSLATKNNWRNQDYRKMMCKRISEAAQVLDPQKISQLRSFVSKRNWNNDIYRAKMLKLAPDIAKKKWQNPIYRQKMMEVRLRMPATSKQQEILYSIIDDLNVSYFSDRSKECAIGFYVFDCRINPQPVIQITRPLIIEVQGDYWHNLPETVRNDKSKATYLKTYFPEFDLKYIWEHEFISKDRVINLIKYWLGITQRELIDFDFNEIEQRIVNPNDVEIFISKYHYAGRVGISSTNLGYYINNILIAVIIYSYPVRQQTATKQGFQYKQVLELSRLCIHPSYQKKNLASNIIARSINYVKLCKPEIKCLVSFADRTYNHFGVIYKASNWQLDGEVPPDYWYVDIDGYVSHKKTLWNKASGLGLTETEYCVKYKFMKTYGSIKYRYIYQLDGG